MKNALKLLTLTVALGLPVASAQSTSPAGTTGSGTPTVQDSSNPSNQDRGTDWGWLGLAGLLGLAGRKYTETYVTTTSAGTTTTTERH